MNNLLDMVVKEIPVEDIHKATKGWFSCVTEKYLFEQGILLGYKVGLEKGWAIEQARDTLFR